MGLKKYSFPVIFILVLSIAAMSCASTPPETENEIEEQAEPVPEQKAVSEVSTPQEAEPEVNIYFEKMVEAKAITGNSKIAADKAKAFKGSPENYNEAEKLFAQAVTLEENEDFQTAAEKYYQADEAYKLSIIKTEENKQAALEAMKAMDNAISNTEKKAEDAVKEAVEEDER